MQVRIQVLVGKDAGLVRSFALADGGEVVCGRGAECELALWDESASRRHAALRRTGTQLCVIDLGSANGTRVNGQPVQESVLTGGERVHIGGTELRVEIAGFQERPTAVLRPEDESYAVEGQLAREAVALPARWTADAGHRRRLELLLELVEQVQAAEAGESILARLAEVAGATLGGAVGGSARPASHALVVPIASRSAEPLWQEALPAGVHDEDALPVSRSVVRRVLAEGVALRVRDTTTDPLTRGRASVVERPVRSLLAVPVAGRQRIHAVLSVESTHAPYTEEDLAYAATLGQVAGMALENAEKLQRTRRVLDARERTQTTTMLTRTSTVQRTVELVARFAASGGPVLIHGETGTGKELLARHAHASGPFASGPWIPVNCAAIPGALLESELFGHEKGAFTGATGRRAGMFELAHEGTLFLDEIGDMPLELQGKLLRVLESGEFFRVGGRAPVRVRLLVVSATHHDLRARVAAHAFREDLFFRLSRFQVEIAPLRARPDDVPLLAEHFVTHGARQAGGEPRALSAASVACLTAYSWPGNVRELRNVIERACVLATGARIEPVDLLLPGMVEATTASGPDTPAGMEGARPSEPPPNLDTVEAEAIQRALQYTGGKKGEAAQLLGISWPTLRRKLRRYGIQ